MADRSARVVAEAGSSPLTPRFPAAFQEGGPGRPAGSPPPREGPRLKSGEPHPRDPDRRTAHEDNDYDDDFNSTSHRSDNSRSELSIGEEIEEVSIEGPDGSDKLDDLTQDLSVSQLSQGADYMEEVA
ncbi:hypothetical protein ANANG_G00118930 [Anguilla anguilla]|uniref:Uncharacterized protein n=1 Tax=Anguilla anguilla TaxID=7936 RepID=A0A9D3MD40_ANGAN|nr:hypothetical protein ANANG_G00118930 [Anguilla anguilla]